MKDRSLQSRTQAANLKSARVGRDGGYLLLAIMLMMAFMIIAATIAAPRIIQQMKRDREEEMIHRGTRLRARHQEVLQEERPLSRQPRRPRQGAD